MLSHKETQSEKKKSSSGISVEDVDEISSIDETFGPCLPPHLLKKKQLECRQEQKIYGPTLPDILRHNENNEGESGRSKLIGPEIPEHLKRSTEIGFVEEENDDGKEDSNEDDACFGPSPELMANDMPSSSTCISWSQKKTAAATDDGKGKRETWMLELPENKTGNLFLGARRFRLNHPTEKEADRSVWTETPQDKLNKKSQKKEKDYTEFLKTKILEEKNKEMEALIEKASSKKKRRKEKSLMEIHAKKMNKKKKKEAEKDKDKKPERRPFDRNVDLQICRIDENQRKSILTKAMYLNNRFAAGESKYL